MFVNSNILKKFSTKVRTELENAVAASLSEFGINRDNLLISSTNPILDSISEHIIVNGFDKFISDIAYSSFITYICMKYMKKNHISDFDTDICSHDEFISHSDKLHKLFPLIFPEKNDYKLFIFPMNYFRSEAFYEKLNSIPDSEWHGLPLIIGKLHQYYISSDKTDIFRKINNNIKISGRNISLVTQIFTPEWIVKYLVENSLGKYILNKSGLKHLKKNWKFYINSDDENTSAVDSFLPQELKIIDPCMGSGNILVYAFELLMQVYLTLGFNKYEATALIIEKNLYGLELDSNVYAIACFQLLMTAYNFDNSVLERNLKLNLYHFQNVNNVLHKNADTLGSLLSPKTINLKIFSQDNSDAYNIFLTLSQKYNAVITNPPYISSSSMNNAMISFIKSYYPDFKSDLFSVFIARCIELTDDSAFIGMLTPYVWMFIKSYEALRNKIYNETTIESLIQLEYSAFEGAVVPVCAFVLKNIHEKRNGSFIRLTDFKGGMELQRHKTLEAINNPQSSTYVYKCSVDNFRQFPGKTMAYWLSEKFQRAFLCPPLSHYTAPKQGLITGDNKTFLRFWFEVDKDKIAFSYDKSKKWFPINKGGQFRRWYGNREYVILWENDGYAIKNFKDNYGRLRSRPQNLDFNFTESVSWSLVTSADISARIYDKNFMFNVAGISIFPEENMRIYLLALLNSKVISDASKIINPTMNMNVGDAAKLPVVIDENNKNEIIALTNENISVCRDDYDSFETSWNFKKHPLI